MTTERLTRLIGLQEEARKARETLVAQRAAVMQVAEDEGREDLTETEDTESYDSGFDETHVETPGEP